MFIAADCEKLQYEGRIDFTDKSAPIMVYPCSYVKIRFYGKYLAVRITNFHNYWDNYIGYILDGSQNKIQLSNLREETEYILLNESEEDVHEVLVFKRQDACHHLQFNGFVLNEGAKLLPCFPLPNKKIEVFGDSISAGEVSEAISYTGMPDPEEHNGIFSNSWYSYSWILARKLNARIHDIAQGGVALRNGSGWFHEPDYIGMEDIYDKISYQKELGTVTSWNFNDYIPHVVIIALGQNDSHPIDFMKQDMNSVQSTEWKIHYQQFIKRIRKLYPNAEIILATSILKHDSAWDMAIGECNTTLKDSKVHHFLYHKNGRGTPGHIRIPEAEKMAEDLYQYIKNLGDDIWNDNGK